MSNKYKTFSFFILIVLGHLLFTGCTQNKPEEKEAEEIAVKAKAEDKILTDELSIQSGQQLFNQHCAACHNFESAEIGPNLSGVTSERDKEWLMSFIKNAPKMIESGDERAVELFEKYKQYMPAFTMLKDEDIEHLLAFIHRFSRGIERSKNNRPGGIINPIPERVSASGISLVLEKMTTIPPSAENPPLARINKFSAVEGSWGERLFIHDLRGKLYEINNTQPNVYLDIAEQFGSFIHTPGWGTGFGSFAFHPEFEKNGLFYTTHTDSVGTAPADFTYPDSIRVKLQWVLMEWKADDAKAATFTGTNRELLRIDTYGTAHGVQEVTFNPLPKVGQDDYGMLYLCVGDGSAAFRYPFMCGDKSKIWGTVVRIDPTGNNSENGKYGIPKDNPFVNDPDALGEVWALGFRNPHRISWDLSGSGKMFITNIGQHSIEEVNLGIPGAHYGWPEREGKFLYDVYANPEVVYPLPEKDSIPYTYPVAQYDHDDGNAISGGFVYAGDEIPLLKGKYIFGDIPRGKLFYAEVDEMELGQQAPVYQLNIEAEGQPTDLETLTQNRRVDLRLGQDGEGELYIFTKADGVLYKVVDAKRGDNSSPAG